MKKIIIPIISLLILVLVFMVVSYKPVVTKTERATVKLGGQEVFVEVVRTVEDRAKGLSGYELLEDGTGMLFVFPEAGIYPFWMKDMNFAIDILWINDGVVVDLWRNAKPQVAEEDVPQYVPGSDATYVLEVPAGFTEEYNVRLGDEIKIIYL